MKILIIEDEDKARHYLARGLSEQGYIVESASNGKDGLYLAQNSSFDLIVLDIMLPQQSGWDVLAALRAQQNPAKILCLTALDSTWHKVKGLELGADDYLAKPYAFSECLARVRALLRRNQANTQDQINIADLHIDFLKHRACRGDVVLDLSPKEFNLLVFFARHPGQVLSRTLISEQVWDINFHSDTNVVDVAIKRLREKLDAPFTNKLIHTVRGMGYKFDVV